MVFTTVCRQLLRTSRETLSRNVLVVEAVTFSPGHARDNDLLRPFVFISSQRSNSTTTIPATGLFQKTRLLLQTGHTVPVNANDSAIMEVVQRQYSAKKLVTTASNLEEDSDSDSDDTEVKRQRDSKKHQRGDSEFWRRKMRTLHRILDVNRDGVISFDDLNLLAKRFTDLGHLTPEISAEFLDVMKQTWEQQFGEITPYNLVTAEQLLTDFHHRINDKKMAKRIGRFLPYLFKAVDYDHTGHLNIEQYKLFFRCLGLSDDDAAIAFAVIDENGDGQLSLKEFVHLGRQFFLVEDETNISKMFWGPLIDH